MGGSHDDAVLLVLQGTSRASSLLRSAHLVASRLSRGRLVFGILHAILRELLAEPTFLGVRRRIRDARAVDGLIISIVHQVLRLSSNSWSFRR